MKFFPRTAFVWLVAMLFAVAARADLPDEVAALLKKYGIAEEAVALSVRPMDAPPAMEHNARAPKNPASVIKLVTTLAALELLGPAFEWQTQYLSDGELKDGVLHGDLIMAGNGDPMLTAEKFWRHLLALRELGVQRIQGDFIIDNTAFARLDDSAFDGRRARAYNTPPDAVMTNFSALRFAVEPLQGAIRVYADPPLPGVRVINRLRPAPGKCGGKKSGWSYQIKSEGGESRVIFNGRYRADCGAHSLYLRLMPNRDYTFALFRFIWDSLGGEFNGRLRDVPPANAKLLQSHTSAPLREAITGVNKFSNNVMARQLLLSIGLQLRGKPATPESGAAAIRDWLARARLNLPGLKIQNGAGLSRTSRITARGVTDLLHAAWRGDYRAEFLSSLPLAALDGSMKRRLQGSKLQGRARIKTGSLSGVHAMAGYVRAKSGKYVGVALLIHTPKIHRAAGNRIQDALLRWVYQL